MPTKKLRKKQGIVILLDALGASAYSEDKIKKFLASRSEINAGIAELAKTAPTKSSQVSPSIYTFADTIIITVPFKGKNNIPVQILVAYLLMRRYLFHSFEKGILFRGAFSIGSYIEDSDSNTVMGEAINDAAQWYDKADWMGVASTPRTNNALEYYMSPKALSEPEYILKYPVPIKGSSTLDLYCISWPGAFHNKTLLKQKKSPRMYFLEIFKDFIFPVQATAKFENTKLFYDYVERAIASQTIEK